ncbi:transporter substrate-binding domain-containing protein [Rhizobacter sp. Root1221]|uniref:transporter substrate-binding domain-containing protein n=1 Tax=Rhizobacter sp. Root1221 TaxID=1736433 RepID=UPI0006FBE32D|nr:transporter substrate-binding domain-containing protein [Rhizobacter sp. Root1221]KQV97192.1 amino acid ABC transporter substrate-binding protein [Rhizobacter sp. Root1221]
MNICKSGRLLGCGTVLLLLLLLGATAQAQNALDTILENKKVTIAVPQDIPPYGAMDNDFHTQGLDVDVANYIGAKLGVAVRLVAVIGVNRIPFLESKRVDMVVAALDKTPENEKRIDFAAAYSPFFEAVYGARTSQVKGFEDLAGKTIAVTKGSVEDVELRKLAPQGADIRSYEITLKARSAYVKGQVDLIAANAIVAGYIMQLHPMVSTEFKLLLKERPNYIGVAKGEDKLRQAINGIIADARKNGDLDKMAVRWLGRPVGDLP